MAETDDDDLRLTLDAARDRVPPDLLVELLELVARVAALELQVARLTAALEDLP
jgi:hypothetical protein